MQDLISLLQAHTRDVVNRSAIALQNWDAATADADAIAQAVDRREAHREFSTFTGESGRA